VVVQVLSGDDVARHFLELTVDPDECMIVLDSKTPEIKQDVVVRAQAQDVVRCVRPIVGRTQRADVGGLSVRSARRF
jgi:hypothetical protein